MYGMANPEIVVLNNSWMPIAAVILLAIGLLFALKMTAHSDSRGDKS